MARLSVPAISMWTRPQGRVKDKAVSSIAFDALFVALSTWYVVGLHIDGWAHQHISSLETFFTPWHAIFYSGFFTVSGLLVLALFKNLLQGYSWFRAIPSGYELSLAGVAIFAVGGVADLIWHTLFGIEADLEALLSPTHLWLALGMTLILSGPIRAAWSRSTAAAANRGALWPMVIALTLTMSMLTFFTMYADPFGSTFASSFERASGSLGFYNQALGIVSMLLQTIVLMGFILFALLRWPHLPFGSITFLLGSNTALVAFMRDGAYSVHALSTGALPLIGVAIVGGLIADILLTQLRPSVTRPTSFRLFAFAVPVILYALYFLAVALVGGGVWWTIHLWAGAILLTGIVGYLLSYAFIPPSISAELSTRTG